ncbi:MAG: hypothetical protein FWF52_05425 [Candidatus Azobacteroides sp.]|nr:hypothetical protein [Candidatus Azobacteroides sp.]
MDTKMNLLDETSARNPFLIPEGYFEGLSDQIMSQLPERVGEPAKTVSLWQRAQTWVYMAAMFIIIALTMNLFTSLRTPKGLNLNSASDIDEFYQFYEDQLADNFYREAFYLNGSDNFEITTTEKN